jgi:hypothetical protein
LFVILACDSGPAAESLTGAPPRGRAIVSFNEAKALATDNPLLMDKAEADTTLTRLQRAARAHARNQDGLRHTITPQQGQVASLTAHLDEIDAAIFRRQDTSGDKFAMIVADRRHARRADAGQHLMAELSQAFSRFDGMREQALQPVALAGFPLTARLHRVLGTPTVTVGLDGAPGTSIDITAHELSGADPAGLVTQAGEPRPPPRRTPRRHGR